MATPEDGASATIAATDSPVHSRPCDRVTRGIVVRVDVVLAGVADPTPAAR